MDKKSLMKLADGFQKKADAAFENYQQTGMSRYGSAYRRNEELADALRMAAGAADEHHVKRWMRRFWCWRPQRTSTVCWSRRRPRSWRHSAV